MPVNDEVGNTIIMTDTPSAGSGQGLGQRTRTYYDMLGREEYTVANWNPATFADPAQDCIFSPDNASEENICTRYEYDAAGNQTVVTNALGQQSLTVYDGLNRPFIRVTGWDGVTSVTGVADCSFPPARPDSNLCMVTEYDQFGRPITTTNPLGQQTIMGYDSAGRVVTTTRYLDQSPISNLQSYDALGRRLSQTDPLGHTTTFGYDSLGRPIATVSAGGVVISQTYDALGRTLMTVQTSITGTQRVTTTMTYDALDRLVSTQDGEGNLTTYEYDILGNQTAVIDANGVRTSYEYDGLQRLARVIENNSGGEQTDDSNVVTEYFYDVLGNQVKITNARNFTSTQVSYDALNRPIATADALGNETRVQYNALGLRTVITDANGELTRYEYDGLNRPLTVTYEAAGQTVSYEYNAVGNRLAMGGGLGVTRYQYDDLARMTTVTDTFGAVVSYGYDLVGNRTRLTYPDGRVVTYTYDTDNRMTGVIDWDGSLTGYAYDDLGRLITMTLPNGVRAVHAYDDAHRLASLRYTAADETLIAEYLYEVDGVVGNRQVVTETLLSPEILETIQIYQEANGLLVLEAENGTTTSGTAHNWISQTVQTGYAGPAYLRALPDVGQRTETNELAGSPRQSFSVQISNPADYTVWVRGMAPDAAGDSVHVGVNGNFNYNAALTGFTNQWGWSRQTMSATLSSLPLNSSGVYTLDLSMREDGLRIDRLLLVTDTNTIPSGAGPAESEFVVISNTTPAELTSHTIQYTYDDLYRLTDALYTGDITATYSYAYDPVGNMTAYTETAGTQTTRVTRYFDNANRLQAAFDYDQGTTSYLYDNNGNLTLIIPAGGGDWLHYGYDQRNLMITHTLSVSGTNPQLQADFTYDGAGNRVRQVDYTSMTPITTTYANDILGLTQVLVADDGTTQVHNLFGLDLIGQDDGTDTRYLLTNGLGSVRTEMVGDSIETVTTYDPYGNLLAQTGESGTTYGYTGEQHDDTTGLLYLRARYYNPALHSFMGRDPWQGSMNIPQSMNGWSYVENNPVNFVDYTGRRSFPEHCNNNSDSKIDYIECVTDYFGVFYPLTDWEQDQLENIIPQSELDQIIDFNGCYYGPVPYRGKGYYEGKGETELIIIEGEQIVYDFAKLERLRFSYSTLILSESGLSWNTTLGAGTIYQLRSWRDVALEYGGLAIGYSVGFAPSLIIEASTGWEKSFGLNDPTIHTAGQYWHYGFNTDIGISDSGGTLIKYEPIRDDSLSFEKNYVNFDHTVKESELVLDILFGAGSPISGWQESIVIGRRALAISTAIKYANVHDDMWRPSVAR